MIKKILLILLFVITTQLQAQKLFDNDNTYDIFHSYTKWGIQLDPLMYFPASISSEGRQTLKPQYAFGYKFGLVYNINFSNRFGFRVGALTGQVPAINTYFVLNKRDISADMDYYHKKGAKYSPFFSNFSFPLLFEYRNFLIDRYILNFDAGIQIERTGSAVISEFYDNYYVTTVENKGSWDFDLVFKVGWYFQFRKAVMMQTNLVYKHRFANQYEGNYQFPNINHSSVIDKYIQKGDYIGLSMDFFFYRRTRQVEAGCRANTQSQKVKKRQKAADKAREKAKKRQEKIKRKKAKKMRKKARRRR